MQTTKQEIELIYFTPRSLINSEVEYTFILDCFFNALSFDHIGQSKYNANAKKSASFKSGEMFIPSFIYSLYSSSGINFTTSDNFSLNISNCCDDNFVFDNMSSLYLSISLKKKNGAYNSKEGIKIIFFVKESFQKNENRMLELITSFIYLNLLSLKYFNLDSLILLPSSIASFSVNSLFCSASSKKSANDNLLSCLTINSFDISSQLISGCLLNSFVSSSGTDIVIVPILSSQNELSINYYLKLVQNFGNFGCQKLESSEQRLVGFKANSGNVGIGTTSPATVLDVKGKANFTGNFSIGQTSNIFFVDNTSSNVGIGTKSPNSNSKLEVVGDIYNKPGQGIYSHGAGNFNYYYNFTLPVNQGIYLLTLAFADNGDPSHGAMGSWVIYYSDNTNDILATTSISAVNSGGLLGSPSVTSPTTAGKVVVTLVYTSASATNTYVRRTLNLLNQGLP